MNAEFDYDLTPDQWNVLRALRAPAGECGAFSGRILDQLIVLELAAIDDDRPRITAEGRSVLLRGSPLLMDLVA